MTQVHRVVDGIALSVAATVLCLAACGADPTAIDSGRQTPIGNAQAGTGTATAARGGAPVAGISGTVVAPPGAGTGVAVRGPAAGSGATLPPPVAGSAAAVAGTGAPTGAAGSSSTATTTWDPQANLDAMGNLKAPAAGEGFQIATPMFDLAPGQEVFKCYRIAVPPSAEFPVGEWDGQMSAGSHHFILYRSGGDAMATEAGVLTNGACTQGFGGTTWLYTQGSPRGHLQFPDGVAMTLAAKEKLNFDMHYINTGTTTIHARIVLNVNKVKAAMFEKADAQISFNIGISVPAHGTQTVQGDCTPVAGAKYFVMQTHTHKFATLAVVNRKLANGTMGEELVRTTDWDNPTAHIWQAAPFLTFQPGEKFHYSCSYKNDTNATVSVGISADVNEMCMAEAYFFPASTSTPQCN
jgi:hypothetical protein